MRVLVPVGAGIAVVSLAVTAFFFTRAVVPPDTPHGEAGEPSVVRAFRWPLRGADGSPRAIVSAGRAVPLQGVLYRSRRNAPHHYALRDPRLEILDLTGDGAGEERVGREGPRKASRDPADLRAGRGTVSVPSEPGRPVRVELSEGVRLRGPSLRGRLRTASVVLGDGGDPRSVRSDRTASIDLDPLAADPGLRAKAYGGLRVDLVRDGALREGVLRAPVEAVLAWPPGPEATPGRTLRIASDGDLTVRPRRDDRYRLETSGRTEARLDDGTTLVCDGLVVRGGEADGRPDLERAVLEPPVRLAIPGSEEASASGGPVRHLVLSDRPVVLLPGEGRGFVADLPGGGEVRDRRTGAVHRVGRAWLAWRPGPGATRELVGRGGVRSTGVRPGRTGERSGGEPGGAGWELEGRKLRVVEAEGIGRRVELVGDPVRARRADGARARARRVTRDGDRLLLEGAPAIRAGGGLRPRPWIPGVGGPTPPGPDRLLAARFPARLEARDRLHLSPAGLRAGKGARALLEPRTARELLARAGRSGGAGPGEATGIEGAVWELRGPGGLFIGRGPDDRIASLEVRGARRRPARLRVLAGPPGVPRGWLEAATWRWTAEGEVLRGEEAVVSRFDAGSLRGREAWAGTRVTVRGERAALQVHRRGGGYEPGLLAVEGTGERRLDVLLEGGRVARRGPVRIVADRATWDPAVRYGILAARPDADPVVLTGEGVEARSRRVVLRGEPGWVDLLGRAELALTPGDGGGDRTAGLVAPWMRVVLEGSRVESIRAGGTPPVNPPPPRLPGGWTPLPVPAVEEGGVRVTRENVVVEGPEARWSRDTGLLVVPDYRLWIPDEGGASTEERGSRLSTELDELEEVIRREAGEDDESE